MWIFSTFFISRLHLSSNFPKFLPKSLVPILRHVSYAILTILNYTLSLLLQNNYQARAGKIRKGPAAQAQLICFWQINDFFFNDFFNANIGTKILWQNNAM